MYRIQMNTTPTFNVLCQAVVGSFCILYQPRNMKVFFIIVALLLTEFTMGSYDDQYCERQCKFDTDCGGKCGICLRENRYSAKCKTGTSAIEEMNCGRHCTKHSDCQGMCKQCLLNRNQCGGYNEEKAGICGSYCDTSADCTGECKSCVRRARARGVYSRECGHSNTDLNCGSSCDDSSDCKGKCKLCFKFFGIGMCTE